MKQAIENKGTENPVYHDTWMLLRKYRDVVWSLELSVQQVRRQFTRANLWWLLPAAAAAVAAFVWLVKRIKRAILRSAKKEGRRT